MELWDLYTANHEKTGRLHTRGETIPEDFYHDVVHVWIEKDGRFLLSQRAADSYRSPLKWECTCGSVLANETPAKAALREVLEEVGMRLNPETVRLVKVFRRDSVAGKRLNDFIHVFRYHCDDENFDLSKATTAEVADCRWVTLNEFETMLKNGEVIPSQRYALDLLKEEKE